MGVVKKTLWHTGIYAFGAIASRGVGYLLIPMYTRLLDKSAIANWDLSVTAVLFLVPLLDIGTAASLLRYYHFYDTEGERRRFFGTGLTVVVSAQAVVLAAVWVWAEPIGEMVFREPGHVSLIRLTTLLGSATVLSHFPLSWLRAQERSTAYVMLNLVRAAVSPVTVVVLVAALGMGVEGILWGEAAGLVAMTLIGFAMCPGILRMALDLAMLRHLLAYGLPLLPMGIGIALLTVSDRFFLRDWLGSDELAVYAIGARVGILIQFATQALQLAYPPAAFRIAKQPDAQDVLGRLLRLITLGLFAMAVAFSSVGPELLRIFAPASEYAGALCVIPWIALAYAVHSSAFSVMAAFAITRKVIYSTIVVCTSGALKLALNFLLIGRYGIVGAAIATLLSFLIEAALGFYFSQRLYPLRHDWGRLAGMYALTLSCVAVYALATPLYGTWMLPVRVGLLALYLAVSARLFLRPQERVGGLATVMAAWRRVPGMAAWRRA